VGRPGLGLGGTTPNSVDVPEKDRAKKLKKKLLSAKEEGMEGPDRGEQKLRRESGHHNDRIRRAND